MEDSTVHPRRARKFAWLVGSGLLGVYLVTRMITPVDLYAGDPDKEGRYTTTIFSPTFSVCPAAVDRATDEVDGILLRREARRRLGQADTLFWKLPWIKQHEDAFKDTVSEEAGIELPRDSDPEPGKIDVGAIVRKHQRKPQPCPFGSGWRWF